LHWADLGMCWRLWNRDDVVVWEYPDST
jgi:hypothetical protein